MDDKDKENMDENKQEEKTQETENKEEIEKVKVGEKEYTQEELSSVVGLGETAREFETKWNRKIDQFYPDYTQKSQRLAEFEKKEKEAEDVKLKEKVETKQELSPEEVKKIALEEADKLDLIHKGNINQYIASFLQARDLIDDAEGIIAQADEDGKPKTTVNDLLAYMEETGIKSPEIAYKNKFESELDEWKSKQLDKVKNPGMKTMDTSTAGGKEFIEKKAQNIDELRDQMKSYLQNRTG